MTPGCPEDPQRLSDGGYPLDQLGSSPVRVLRTPGGSRASKRRSEEGQSSLPFFMSTGGGTILELRQAVASIHSLHSGQRIEE